MTDEQKMAEQQYQNERRQNEADDAWLENIRARRLAFEKKVRAKEPEPEPKRTAAMDTALIEQRMKEFAIKAAQIVAEESEYLRQT